MYCLECVECFTLVPVKGGKLLQHQDQATGAPCPNTAVK
jgi:hypothetical protein